jgi:hypothetical protein
MRSLPRPTHEQLAVLQRLALAEVEELISDPELDEGDLVFRAAQLAACARGELCSELAFHPIAQVLHYVASANAVAGWSDDVAARIATAVRRRQPLARKALREHAA